MKSSILSIVSAAVAVAAVAIAIWQVRANSRSAERSHTLPIVSEVYREFRSLEFRNSMSYLITSVPKPRGEEGFRSLPRKWQEHAYRVCYLFDYLGTLVSFGIVREELAVSLWGTWAMRIWLTIEPFIKKEREYRRKTYPPGVSPGFLLYYEDFVCRIVDLGGEDAPRRIQQRSGLRRLDGSRRKQPR